MSTVTAIWPRVASLTRLNRSSQTVSVIGDRAWILGGELEARQPIDNQFDVEKLSSTSAAVQTAPAPTEAPIPRVGSTSTVLNGIIYFFSGFWES